MAPNFATDKMPDAIDPEEYRSQGSNFGTGHTQHNRQRRQNDTDIDATQIEQTVGYPDCPHYLLLRFIQWEGRGVSRWQGQPKSYLMENGHQSHHRH